MRLVTTARDGDLDSEIELFRATTPTERGRVLEALCRMAAEQVAQHLDPQRTLDWQDPLSPETEIALKRLRERYRGTRGGLPR